MASKPRQINIQASHSTPIKISPGKDKHGYYLEIGAERMYGGKCVTPSEVKRLIEYLNRFVDWSAND